MIDKINNVYKIICNACGKVFNIEFQSFQEAVMFKKKNGWRSVMLSASKWNEICPDCLEFDKRLKG